MFDRTSRIIRTVVIPIAILLLSSVIVVVFMNMKNKEDKQDETKYVGTTSRRTYKTTSSTSKKTTTSIITIETDPTTTSTVSTTLAPLPTTVYPTTTTSKKTTKKTTTTGKKTTRKTTKKTTKKTTTTTEFVDDREIAVDSSHHELAVDSWEWGIVDLINEERESMGYEPVQVLVELRDLAEYAADYWFDHSNQVIDEIIGNNSYYGTKLINANYLESYKYLYDKTISNIDITTNPDYRYVGVGVIYRDYGDTGMRTHYYIIIYE